MKGISAAILPVLHEPRQQLDQSTAVFNKFQWGKKLDAGHLRNDYSNSTLIQGLR